MRRVVSLLALGLVGCAASPTAGAPTTTTSESSLSPPATSHVEAVPAALEGRILLGDKDTFYLANADGSAVEQLADPRQYCCLARISPDHSRILTMPGTDETSDGTALTQITEFTNTVISHKVGFFPDGPWIVFAKTATNGRNDVFIAKADGSGVRPVTSSAQSDSSPDWSPQ